MITLLIATRNEHKVVEIRSILGADFRYLTLKDFPEAPEVVEDAPTFSGNAILKAVGLSRWLSNMLGKRASSIAQLPNSAGAARERMFVLADDSGLEVDALGGKPGVHSARFASLDTGAIGNSTSADNNAKLLRLLQNVPREKRGGRFRCVLALTPVLQSHAESASPVCYADEFEIETELFEGSCEGRIEFSPRGLGGFGYDPLFVPKGYEQTFSELGEEIKNEFSHRSKALAQLKVRMNALTGMEL